MSVDLSFMDLLFDKEDPVIGFEKDVKNEDLKPFLMDDKQLNNDDWVCSADSFLDSILQMENDSQPFELLPNCDLLNDKSVSDSFSNLESSSCSDSGMSSDQQMSPPSMHDGEIEIDDVEIKEEVIELDSTDYNDLPTLDMEDSDDSEAAPAKPSPAPLIKLPEVNGLAKKNVVTGTAKPQIQRVIAQGTTDVQQKQQNAATEHKPVIRTKPVGVTNPSRHVLRVTPITSTNPRSILIPVNMKGVSPGVRTIKIINATNRPFPANAIKATKQIPRVLQPPSGNGNDRKGHHGGGDSASDDQASLYPRLHLTAEEKRLMAKEGVSLPSHYPLTKQEERELKRIRRKIRNKISAQDSRKRKKEYVDGLEDRVKQCTEENLTLMKRLKALQSQNQSLSAQLKKLQAVVARSTTQTAQPATCLMVLMLSLALVMAPNLRHVRSATHRDLALPEPEVSKNAIADAARAAESHHGRSRSLLFTKPSEVKFSQPQALTESDDSADSGLISDLEELLQFNKPQVAQGLGNQYDHDYTADTTAASRKRTRSYIVPPLDDDWPPPPKKILRERIADSLNEKVNKSRLGADPMKARDPPVVIHLMSDDEDKF